MSLDGPTAREPIRRAAHAYAEESAHPGWSGDVIEACRDLRDAMNGSVRAWTPDDAQPCCHPYLPEQGASPIIGDAATQRIQHHRRNAEHITAHRQLTPGTLDEIEQTMWRLMHALDRVEDTAPPYDTDQEWGWEWCMRLIADGVPPLRARLYRLAGLPEAEARTTEAAGLTVERAEALIALAGLRGGTDIVLRGMAYTDPYHLQTSGSANYL